MCKVYCLIASEGQLPCYLVHDGRRLCIHICCTAGDLHVGCFDSHGGAHFSLCPLSQEKWASISYSIYACSYVVVFLLHRAYAISHNMLRINGNAGAAVDDRV